MRARELWADLSDVARLETVQAQPIQLAVCMGRMVPRTTDSAYRRFRALLVARSIELSLGRLNTVNLPAIPKGSMTHR